MQEKTMAEPRFSMPPWTPAFTGVRQRRFRSATQCTSADKNPSFPQFFAFLHELDPFMFRTIRRRT
jgi:hypothetical protein